MRSDSWGMGSGGRQLKLTWLAKVVSDDEGGWMEAVGCKI